MNLIIPKDLLPYVDCVREKLSRPVFIIKCIVYIKIMGITLEDIDKTIAANYERADDDRIDKSVLERQSRHKY